MRSIKVSGQGRGSAAPDQIRLTLTLTAQDMDYAQAAARADRQYADLRAAIASAGHPLTELKTSNYRVTTEYKTERHDQAHHQVFDGYRFTHDLSIIFGMDLKRLSETIEAVSQSESDPTLRVAFELSAPENLRDQVLADATHSAKRRAQIIANSAGVKLGQLMAVTYDWSNVDDVSPTHVEPRMFKAMALETITPDSVEMNETIRFEWSLAD